MTKRSLAAVVSAVLVVGGLGWLWQASLLPHSYSVTSMGYPDYGVDADGKPLTGPPTHEAHGSKGVSVTDLVEPGARAADVEVDLDAQTGLITKAGHDFVGYAVNGRTPGPTITADQGQLIEVRLSNRNVDEGVALHWHGIDVPNAEDGVAGVTQNAVLPGKTHTYRFVAEQAGTYWYHSHQVSHEQVAGGLFGPIVVEPKGGIKQKRDLIALAHTFGGNRTLNGQVGDVHADAKPGETVRIRIINTDNATLSAWSSVPYTVLAVDGRDLTKPPAVTDQRLAVPAGGRADIKVQVPPTGAARVQVGPGTSYVVGPRTAYPEAPPQPSETLDLLAYGADKRPALTPNRVFTYSIGRRPGFLDGKPGFWWTINGHLYPDVPMFMVRTGDVAKFHIENHSGEPHPMHLHGHHALVVARDGKPATGAPLWVDSVEVPDGGTLDLVFRADNPGIWMDHCHNLPHATEGLVAHLMYEGVRTPFEVGGRTENQPE